MPCIKRVLGCDALGAGGFSCCNPKQQISSAPACQGIEGCQLCLCHMKAEPPAAVDEAVFNWAWMVLYS